MGTLQGLKPQLCVNPMGVADLTELSHVFATHTCYIIVFPGL